MHITGQVQQRLFRPFIITGFLFVFAVENLKNRRQKRGTPTIRNVGVESQLFGRQLLFIYRYYVSTLFSFFVCLLRLIKYFSFHPRWCQPREKMHRGLEQHRSCPNSKCCCCDTRMPVASEFNKRKAQKNQGTCASGHETHSKRMRAIQTDSTLLPILASAFLCAYNCLREARLNVTLIHGETSSVWPSNRERKAVGFSRFRRSREQQDGEKLTPHLRHREVREAKKKPYLIWFAVDFSLFWGLKIEFSRATIMYGMLLESVQHFIQVRNKLSYWILMCLVEKKRKKRKPTNPLGISARTSNWFKIVFGYFHSREE